MTSRELERLLAKLTGKTASEMDIRMRQLRGVGQIKKGGRGNHAPQIAADEANLMLLAAVVSARAVDVREELDRFHLAEMFGLADGEVWPFDYWLFHRIARPERCAKVRRIRLNRTAGSVVVEMADGQRSVFIPQGADPGTDPVNYGCGGIVEECVIDGAALLEIAEAVWPETEKKYFAGQQDLKRAS